MKRIRQNTASTEEQAMKVAMLVLATSLAAAAAWAQSPAGIPQGTGPGVHSPLSPFPPLQERGARLAGRMP